MSDWMPVWLFAAAVTVGLALLSLSGLLGGLLGLAWGFVIFPHAAALIIRRTGSTTAGERHERDRQADYWRTSRWQSGTR
jgi:hypothetical protein